MVEGGKVVLDVELRPHPSSTLTVRYVIEDASQVSDDNGGAIEVGASGDAAISLSIVDDDEIEDARESLVVELTEPTAGAGYRLGTESTVTVEIEEGVCDRTAEIRDKLLAATGRDHCTDVTKDDLSGVGVLYTGRLSSAQSDDLQGLSNLYFLHFCEDMADEHDPKGSLTTLPDGYFDHTPALQELNFIGCAIEEIPDSAFSGLPLLRRLHITLPLTRLPNVSKLTKLNELVIEETLLTSLPPDGISNPTLTILLFQSNEHLRELSPAAFRGVPSVRHLSLSFGSIRSLPVDVFSNLPELEWLQVADNQLATLPEGFVFPRTLQSLNLNQNPLTGLPEGIFAGLPELSTLSIGYAKALSLHPNMFRDLTELQHLVLRFSGISELPPGMLAGLAKLETLWLRGNTITSLPRDLFNDLVALEFIDLSHNPGAPFVIEFDLERVDARPLAGSPAKVRLKTDFGFPLTGTGRVSTVNGTATMDAIEFHRGVSTTDEVTITQDRTSVATHVAIGPLTTETLSTLYGLDLRIGKPLVLFRDSDNRMPIANRAAASRTLQVGGDAATYLLDSCFTDDDPLTYSGQSSDPNIAKVLPTDGGVTLAPLAEGRSTVMVTASDPKGLVVTQDVDVVVEPAPDRSSFHIHIDFYGLVSERVRRIAEAASDRWTSIITGDVPEVPVEASPHCIDANSNFTGLIDDLRVEVSVVKYLDLGSALGGPTGIREGSSLPYRGLIVLGRAIGQDDERLRHTFLHEFAHALGFTDFVFEELGLFQNPSLVLGAGADTHFNGPLAIQAFDDAGGSAYVARSKVPLANSGVSNSDSHWAFPELMDVAANGPLSPITAQVFADLGYEVDVAQADEYLLPPHYRGEGTSIAPNRRATTLVGSDPWQAHLANDALDLPIRVTDRQGVTTRIVPGERTLFQRTLPEELRQPSAASVSELP